MPNDSAEIHGRRTDEKDREMNVRHHQQQEAKVRQLHLNRAEWGGRARTKMTVCDKANALAVDDKNNFQTTPLQGSKASGVDFHECILGIVSLTDDVDRLGSNFCRWLGSRKRIHLSDGIWP